MSVHNQEIAQLLRELADLLAISGGNRFRIRAYKNAAMAIDNLPRGVAEMVNAQEDLTQIPGVGKDLSEKITTIVETGKLPYLEQMKQRVPGELALIMKIRGLGPKKVKALYEQLGVTSFKDLERAAKAKKIRQLKGFSKKTEAYLLDAIERYQEADQRFLLASVQPITDELVAYLQQYSGTKKVTVAGSFRRRCETVGDLDILVTHKQGADVIEHFVQFSKIQTILSKGTTRSTVRLHSGLQVDLRVVPSVCYGAAMHYFTGSKAHNVALRREAIERGWKLNEYGVFEDGRRIGGKTETEVYQLLGYPYIEPELRENRGELEAAKAGTLPKLIRQKDLKGDLHCHTNQTDGFNTLEEMVAEAQAMGYQYMAITDHTQHLTVARGQDPKRLLKQIQAIDRFNEQLDGFCILKSVEVDILKDGSLDMTDEVLAQLDLTVCSVHTHFDLPEQQQMQRLLRAMDHPSFTILAHPSGRILQRREPMNLSMSSVLEALKVRKKWVEVNAQPLRMDLSDVQVRLAKEIGVKMVISTDSHSTAQLHNIGYGVGQARRGWAEKKDVVNTSSLKQLRKLLRSM